jgi:hypothetical protein
MQYSAIRAGAQPEASFSCHIAPLRQGASQHDHISRGELWIATISTVMSLDFANPFGMI